MTREERLLEAAGLLAKAFDILGEQWPLLATQVSHVQATVQFSVRALEGQAA